MPGYDPKLRNAEPARELLKLREPKEKGRLRSKARESRDAEKEPRGNRESRETKSFAGQGGQQNGRNAKEAAETPSVPITKPQETGPMMNAPRFQPSYPSMAMQMGGAMGPAIGGVMGQPMGGIIGSQMGPQLNQPIGPQMGGMMGLPCWKNTTTKSPTWIACIKSG